MARSLDQDQSIAFQRFGLGAKRGSRAALGSDPRGALLAELVKPDAALISDPTLMTSNAAMGAHFAEQKRISEEEKAKRANPAASTPPAMAGSPAGAAGTGAMAGNAMGTPATGGMEAPKPANAPAPRERIESQIRRQELMARFKQGFEAPVGLAERLVLFWSNHFSVSIFKGLSIQAGVGAMEREAIRPHVLGRFEDMLLAVERHQAMQIFLDNWVSIGPTSRAGINQKKGLNENLAREILELHTLGVDGGYSQADVTSLARVLTGWAVVGPAGVLGTPGTFIFNPNAHEPGDHAVLGKSYPTGGIEQGQAVLRDLARHPATARTIARKLARHFVADEPPKSLVSRLEKTFRDTSGDLKAVTRALIESEEAWSAPATKLRTPYEFVLAAYRLINVLPQEPGPIMGGTGALGQPIWGPAGPNGHSDAFDTLAAPEAMKTRMEIAWAFGRRAGGNLNPFELAEEIYGGAISPDSLKAIGRAESKQQGLALLLMTPEFQRR